MIPESYGSAAHELFVAVVNLSRPADRLAELDWLQTLVQQQPQLAERVRAYWPPGSPIAPPGSELFLLAAAGGLMADDDPVRLLADIPGLSASALAGMRSDRPVPGFAHLADLVCDRLEALLNPERAAAYAGLLANVWAAVRPEWEARGLAVAQAEAALFRHRAEQGTPWQSLVPRWHPVHLELFAPVLQAYHGRIHVLPSYFASGGHIYDMAGSLYIGYSVRGESLRTREAERARAVAVRLKALADPTRLAMLSYLAQIPVSVSDLAAVLGVSQPTVSQHLQLLRNAGLVSQHRQGNKVYYHTEREALAEALEQTRRAILH